MKKRPAPEQAYDILNFGEKLYDRMYSCEISKAQLARDTGLCRDIIRKYINNETSPSLEIAWKLSKHLNFSLDALYYRREGRADYRKEDVMHPRWDHASYRNAAEHIQAKIYGDQVKEQGWEEFKQTFIGHLKNCPNEYSRLQRLQEVMEIYIQSEMAANQQRGTVIKADLLDRLMRSIQTGAKSLCETWTFILRNLLLSEKADQNISDNFNNPSNLYSSDDLSNELTNE